MQTKDAVMISDHSTDTQLLISPELYGEQEKLARSLMAVYASHNTQINLKDSSNGMRTMKVPEQWILAAINFQRTVQSIVGLPWDLRQQQDVLRDITPRLQERRTAGIGSGGSIGSGYDGSKR
jgi:hypothetical protein